MTRGVKVRLMLFVILSAVGIVYVTASYLGVVDKVLGRGFTVEASLPDSGGLYEGASVTYRGVKIGKVAKMTPTSDGLVAKLALDEGTKLPKDSSIYVHNLSAVGEQYLDFEPASSSGPYATEGTKFTANAASLPVGEDDLLIQLDEFVSSVDKKSTSIVLDEVGAMFADTDAPLNQLIEGGVQFVDEATAHTAETIRLLRAGQKVLQTQKEQGENITSFARDLSLLTDTLKKSDKNLRRTMRDAPPALQEVQGLLKDLEPTIPVMLANMIDMNGVIMANITGVEQILVEFPRAVAAGFTGTPGDGWGHTNIQLAQTPTPCTGPGYIPASEWRSPHDLTDAPTFEAGCQRPDALQRGSDRSPTRYNWKNGAYRSTYDPQTGISDSLVDQFGNPVRVNQPRSLSVLGDDSWKWMLVGPVNQ
ncbi:MlaD family protein [Nocardioides sp. Bht2]|uniref:MlaD family protein n=1 Tax=Nocardioides sp. Bht2 TaxID=3392297 RepID=UPI0039B439D5